MYSRTKILLGDKIQKLISSKVIVFGVGGVGGYVVEMLARAGVENITVVDFDVVDVTNINRQIIALNSTVGKYKVDVLKDRVLDINPNCNIVAIKEKLEPTNIDSFNLKDYDYVIDAIDMVTSKVALIVYAKSHGINIVSAMGAGNRLGVPNFEVADIFDTYNDGLAKIMRKKLKDQGIKSHTVVFSKNIATPNGKTIGSISYSPAMCGCVLSAFVIDELLK